MQVLLREGNTTEGGTLGESTVVPDETSAATSATQMH